MQTVVSDSNFTRVDLVYFSSSKLSPLTSFIHGTVHTLIDTKFSQRANAELEKNRVDTVLVLIESASHGFDATAWPGGRTFDHANKAFEILKTHAQESRSLCHKQASTRWHLD